MIDERTLTDSLRCPSCGGPVSSAAACPTCAVDLSSATAARVWRVSVEAATLLQERARLIDQLRSEARSGRPAPVRAAQAAIAPAPAPGLAGPRGPVPPEVPAAPRPEWTRRRVQNLLLSLGVALLAVAAVIFLVVSWSLLGIGGRATVMVGCTLLAGGAAAAAHRRGLGSTAEAVSLLTVALALLDAWGAREAGLAGFEGGDGLAYWAGALAVVAGLAAAASSVVPTRSFRVAAAVLAQLPVPLLSAHLARTADQPVAIVATGLTLWTVGALGVAAAWPSGSRSRDARLVVAAGGLLAWVAASATAVGAAYGETGSLVLGTALLLVLAGVSAASIWLGAPLAHVPTVGATAATALVVAAAWATPVDQVSDRWLPLVLSLVAVVLLGTATLVPPGRRLPPAAVTFLASLVPVVTVSDAVLVTVAGQLAWLETPWQAARGQTARALVDQGLQRDGGYLAPEHFWRAEVPLLLLVVAAACVLAARLHPALARAHLAAVPAAALAAVTTPLALDLSFTASVALELGAAALLVPAGALCLRRGWRQVGAVTLASGLAVLALTLCFAVAVDVVTLAALPVAALVLAAATVLVAAGPLRLVLGVAAGAVAIAEAAAITRFEGAGWPAVWSLALTLGVLAAAAAGALLRGVVRRGFAVAATALLVADAGALSLWSGGSPATAGLAVTVVAGLLAVGAVWLDALVPALAADQRAVARDVATTAAVGVVAGVAIAAPDADRLWLALLAAGVSAAAAALRPELHRLGWVAGAALTASSWVRLALSDVDAPEPYTVPAGVALLVLGAWRRRRDPSYSSWRAYGTGLTLALVPSLVRAVTDAGNVRPLLLAAAALVVLCSGIARRLQAPLVIGGLVLVVDALVQLAPYLAAVYDAVPRWSLFALAGLLLVVLGATYERRARELRALQQQIASFG